MSKKRRKNQAPRQKAAEQKPVPKFEIGVKGDEFDLRYTRAAAARSVEADSLLRSLSRETRVAGFDFLCFAVTLAVWVTLALSFAFLSRDGNPPRVRLDNLADGSYTAGLSEYYNGSLPFKNVLQNLGAVLGFCEAPEPEEPEIPELPEEPAEPLPEEPPDVTGPVETEPPVTTVPTTTEAPTSAPITEPTTPTIPETRTMYAAATLNIRIAPDSDAMILGYFSVNQEVDVIEISDYGWASIWYNDSVAYASAEFIGEETVATTRATRRTTTKAPETEPPEETEPATTAPEETEPTTAAETTATTETSVEYSYMPVTSYSPATEPPPTTPETTPTTPEPPPETTPEPTQPVTEETAPPTEATEPTTEESAGEV